MHLRRWTRHRSSGKPATNHIQLGGSLSIKILADPSCRLAIDRGVVGDDRGEEGEKPGQGDQMEHP